MRSPQVLRDLFYSMTKVHDDAAPTNHRECSSCACARTSSIRYAPPRATKRAPSLPFRAHTPFSAGMAAHMAVGVAAMPLHALKYTHRRLALPPVCASRLWPSGGAVARPCARCAASRGLCRRFATILTQVAGSVDATRSCAVMVRARRRAGGAVPAGAWAARSRAETASEGRTAPWLAFLALSRVVRFGRWELVSQKWIASGVCQSKALAKTVWDHHIPIKCRPTRIFAEFHWTPYDLQDPLNLDTPNFFC